MTDVANVEADESVARKYLPRMSAVLAWLFAVLCAWFSIHLTAASLLTVLVGVLLVWLGLGAWRAERRRSTALGVLGVLLSCWLVVGVVRIVSEVGPGESATGPVVWPWLVEAALLALMALGVLPVVMRRRD